MTITFGFPFQIRDQFDHFKGYDKDHSGTLDLAKVSGRHMSLPLPCQLVRPKSKLSKTLYTVSLRNMGQYADSPTFYEIKAEDLPPFGKKRGRLFCSENIAIFLSAGDTE